MGGKISVGSKLAAMDKSDGAIMQRSSTVIFYALLALTLAACGTIGGLSRGVGEAASGVGEDLSSVGEWIGNF